MDRLDDRTESVVRRPPEARAPHRILIASDDAPVAAEIVAALRLDRLGVDTVGSLRALSDAFETDLPTALILDSALPDSTGINALRWIRARSDVPVIMVSGTGGIVDRIVGLELGADDYLMKPFEVRELLARLHCILRRLDRRPAASLATAPRTLGFADWTLDLAGEQLRDPRGERIHLTRSEFLLLTLLVQRANSVVSRDQLLDCLGTRHWDPLDRSIDVRISKLRGKIDRDDGLPSFIRTVRGAGYMFMPDRG